ncbi:MAG: hypothetical protein SCK57_08145 [Bacillota bacterium]|nr:hypothetical protein [Bacillota bacterium]MDW7677617.1 hypothetical protein [Bacillota bacterium]
MSSKQIRPLTVYRRENPEMYDYITSSFIMGNKKLSEKQIENEFYWWYGVVASKGDEQEDSQGIEAKIKRKRFFLKDENTRQNKVVGAEIGRLLLHGWYYDIQDFTKKISGYIISGYHSKIDRNKIINDSEFVDAVKHIRENLLYYYNHEHELKLYLMEKLYPEEIKPLLPEPPRKIKIYEIVMKDLKTRKEKFFKGGKDEIFNRHTLLEDYSEYLIELLDANGIGYMDIEQWKEQQQEWRDGYIDEIQKAYDSYDIEKKKVIQANNLLT